MIRIHIDLHTKNPQGVAVKKTHIVTLDLSTGSFTNAELEKIHGHFVQDITQIEELMRQEFIKVGLLK